MTKDDDGTWRISHKDYIHKIQPLPLENDSAATIAGQSSMASSLIFSSHPNIYVLAER